MNPASSASGEGLTPAADSAQEVEVWWGGYAGRTMLPAFALCFLLTAVVVLVASLVWQEEHLSDAVISHFALYLIVALWAVVLVRWAYVTVTISYRLTTRHLLVEYGLAHPGLPPLPLETIAKVKVEQNAWERLVGVGRLRIETTNGRTECLPGVHAPAVVADEILRRVQKARGGSARDA
jgi:uncharacterized membrane protein YdbT with pleckstrin-like domain